MLINKIVPWQFLFLCKKLLTYYGIYNSITYEQWFICLKERNDTQKYQVNHMEEKLQSCGEHHHHDDVVESRSLNMPDEGMLCDLAEFFKVFADSTRIKILYALSEGELCVCDIWQSLGLTQSAVSHQLRILKQMRLVKYRKEGKTIYYSLDDGHIQSILNQGLEHIME